VAEGAPSRQARQGRAAGRPGVRPLGQLSPKIEEMYRKFWKLDAFPYADTGMVDFQVPAPSGFHYPQSAVKPRGGDAKAEGGMGR
jgi:hypothetical protein